MSNISLFKNEYTPGNPTATTIADVINGIKYGKWRAMVEPIRAEADKEARTKLKGQLPRVTFSGSFLYRKETEIIQHSGYICIDIDDTDNDYKTQLEGDIYTYATFISCGGKGRAVLVKVNKEKHKESFRWLQNYYFNTYGIVIDPRPQNVSSTRNVSHDPAIFINEKSKQSKIQKEPKPKIHSLPIIVDNDRVAEYVKECVQRGISIAESYDEYMQLGFAISAGFQEDGRDYFHALCSVSSKYNHLQCNRQYDICLKRNHKGITVGTFYYMLKQVGIEIKCENTQAVQVVAMAKKAKREKSGVIKTLTEVNGLSQAQAEHMVETVYNRPDISLQTIASDPEHLIESLVAFIKDNYILKKNIITGMIEDAQGVEMTTERFNTIYLHARAAYNTPNVSYDLVERIILSEFTPSYHPIFDYIDRNRHRTTTGHIDALIATISTTTPHAGLFIRKWLVCIGAVLNNLPARYVLILLGKQKSGKTEFFRRLLPKDINEKFYAQSKLDREKDDELLMCQKLVIMNDEMGGKSQADERKFKNITSANAFTLRAPYGRSNKTYRRMALLCGTSNDTSIINDPTGNTRILPIEIDAIDKDAYNAIDKDDLFMECYHAFESGEAWNFTDQEYEDLGMVSESYESIAPERELIQQFFLPSTHPGLSEQMTATEIKDYIERSTKQQIRNMTRFGTELKKYFGDHCQVKIGGIPRRFYKLVKINGQVPATLQPVLGEVVNLPF